jgi:hypothetical protein
MYALQAPVFINHFLKAFVLDILIFDHVGKQYLFHIVGNWNMATCSGHLGYGNI